MNVKRAVTALILGLVIALTGTAQAGILYWGGGTAEKTGPLALPTALESLTGTWDTTTKNWATDKDGTTYVAWSNAGIDNEAHFGTNLLSKASDATVTLTSDMALNRLYASGLNMNWIFYLTAASPQTITLNGVNPTIRVIQNGNGRFVLLSNVGLAGSSGFTQLGPGYIQIQSDCSGLTGPVTNRNGQVRITATGNLRNVSLFDIPLGILQVTAGAGANDIIGDNVDVRLYTASSALDYLSYRSNTTPSTETMRQILLLSGGKLNVGAGAGTAGQTKGTLTLAHPTKAIDRGPDEKNTLLVNVDATDALQANVVLQNGFATGVILPWMNSSRAGALQLNGSTIIEPIVMADAPAAASWVGGSDYRITSAVSGNLGSISVRSLGVLIAGNSTVLTIGTGNKLTITSGFVGLGHTGATGTSTITGGQITTTAGGELYLHTGDSNSKHLRINSEITGNISVIRGTGASTVSFGGADTPNTYSGTTYVTGGTLTVDKTGSTAAGRIAIPGNAVIESNGKLSLTTDEQIAPTANVTVRDGGTMDSGRFQTYTGVVTVEGAGVFGFNNNGITFNNAGTGLVFNGGTLRHSSTSTGTANLLTHVSYPATATAQGVMESIHNGQTWLLANVAGDYTRTYNIADSTTLPAGTPELVSYVPFTEVTGTGGITKTGTGELSLRGGTYTLSGAFSVSAGRLTAASTKRGSVQSGTLRNGFAVVSNLTSTVGMVIGQKMTGTVGLPAYVVVKTIDSATQVTMSANASASGASTLTFGTFPAMAKHIVQNGNLVNFSPVVTGLTTTNGLAVGQAMPAVTGLGATTIVSLDSPSQITVAANATGTATRSLTFTGGSAVGRGAVTVSGTGILGGEGVAGDVTVNASGSLDAGNAANQVASMTIGGNVAFNSTGKLIVDLAGPASNDSFLVWGDVALGGTVQPNLLGAYSPAQGSWTVMRVAGNITGAMAAPTGYSVQIVGNTVVLSKLTTGTLITIR